MKLTDIFESYDPPGLMRLVNLIADVFSDYTEDRDEITITKLNNYKKNVWEALYTISGIMTYVDGEIAIKKMNEVMTGLFGPQVKVKYKNDIRLSGWRVGKFFFEIVQNMDGGTVIASSVEALLDSYPGMKFVELNESKYDDMGWLANYIVDILSGYSVDKDKITIDEPDEDNPSSLYVISEVEFPNSDTPINVRIGNILTRTFGEPGWYDPNDGMRSPIQTWRVGPHFIMRWKDRDNIGEIWVGRIAGHQIANPKGRFHESI